MQQPPIPDHIRVICRLSAITDNIGDLIEMVLDKQRQKSVATLFETVFSNAMKIFITPIVRDNTSCKTAADFRKVCVNMQQLVSKQAPPNMSLFITALTKASEYLSRQYGLTRSQLFPTMFKTEQKQ